MTIQKAIKSEGPLSILIHQYEKILTRGIQIPLLLLLITVVLTQTRDKRQWLIKKPEIMRGCTLLSRQGKVCFCLQKVACMVWCQAMRNWKVVKKRSSHSNSKLRGKLDYLSQSQLQWQRSPIYAIARWWDQQTTPQSSREWSLDLTLAMKWSRDKGLS